jgi:hypothetical protein
MGGGGGGLGDRDSYVARWDQSENFRESLVNYRRKKSYGLTRRLVGGSYIEESQLKINGPEEEDAEEESVGES